ncbi:hypothetical protein GCK72_021792 [Caenorhabditis remanei]|uniref:Serpentine receptor class gamma n=1 Tax=Caenorhabditis remanei TaxID=31234 RepID=A0A6A5GKQ7_CAERE|nr:hypothetical protein GCK72_021792 [Caenorhabditis remanei]KAF1755223.1 hypothetical protein GCK72_021792 [Caenorhabditis remanei]
MPVYFQNVDPYNIGIDMGISDQDGKRWEFRPSQSPKDDMDSSYSTPLIIYNIIQVSVISVHFLFLLFNFGSASLIHVRSTFFDLVTIFSSVLSARTLMTFLFFVFLAIRKKEGSITGYMNVFMQVTLYGNFIGDYFSQSMLALMACNRYLSVCSSEKVFNGVMGSRLVWG